MSWRTSGYEAIRPLLFAIDPESIHHVTLAGLQVAAATVPGRALLHWMGGASEGDGVDLMGLRFRSRVGLGAGFDKDGLALRGWAALGFGFAEVGTVTPLPQPGNPRPRLFRLSSDRALINRMGFNNAGADALAGRLRVARARLPESFVVGVNIGRNKETTDERAVEDYMACLRVVAPIADYVAVNVSSPNTPGLRGLQEPDRLAALLGALRQEQPVRPLVVKLAPDLDETQLDELTSTAAESGAAGLILSNTTVSRDGLVAEPRVSAQTGGLSGAPLLPRTIAALERARGRVGDRLVLIASGGIFSGAEAVRARSAGADLVQVWTGMIYRGPGIIGEILEGL